jgi:prepilin-type N-terminal cleavage/methylation domain-containing protein
VAQNEHELTMRTLTTRASSTGRSRRGFTLAELLVVVAVTAILVAVAVPFNQDLDRVGNEARRLLADALRLRGTARTTWDATVLTVDVASSRWKCETADGTPIPGPDSDANGWRSITDNSVSFSAVAGSPSSFVFLPNGRLQDNSAIQLIAGDAVWQISGNALSGKIDSFRVSN